MSWVNIRVNEQMIWSELQEKIFSGTRAVTF